jgi:hypothetical protein
MHHLALLWARGRRAMSSFDFVVLVRLRDGDFEIGPHSFQFGKGERILIFITIMV